MPRRNCANGFSCYFILILMLSLGCKNGIDVIHGPSFEIRHSEPIIGTGINMDVSVLGTDVKNQHQPEYFEALKDAGRAIALKMSIFRQLNRLTVMLNRPNTLSEPPQRSSDNFYGQLGGIRPFKLLLTVAYKPVGGPVTSANAHIPPYRTEKSSKSV